MEEVVAGYDGAPPVLHKVSVTVRPGEITLVVGRNGAGKTTLLRAMSGLLKPRSGRIALEATDLSRKRPSSIARLGIAHVPEDRRVLPAMTVMDNLRVGGWVFRRQKDLAAALDEVADLFPALSAWHSRRAGTLSGGQQQLLSIARAMMLRPTVLLLDEPLTGLDPFFQEQVMQVVGVIRDRGCAVLLVEQNLSRSMPAADHVIVLDEGRVGVRGSAAELTRDEVIKSLFVNAALTSAERNGR